MFQTFISRHNSNFFSDKLVLTSVTPASSAPVLQTPKATSSTLYFDSLTVNAGNGGFLHCIQMDTSVNAANQVVSVGADIRSEERFSRNAETDLVCRLLLEKKKTVAKRFAQEQILDASGLRLPGQDEAQREQAEKMRWLYGWDTC